MWVRACSPVLLFWLPTSIHGAVEAPPDPDFNRDILPIFQRECVGCHSSALKMGGLVLESYQDLMKGGEKGTPLVAGHADQSLLVRMLEGTAEPSMPLNGQLPAEQIQLVRAWIDASARPPETLAAADGEVPIPEIRPRVDVEPPLAALAFHPREKWLARGGFRRVELLDLAENRTLHSLAGPRDLVRSLSFSRDGTLLAAGGGAPAQEGEIRVWSLSEAVLRIELKGHSDCVYALDFDPGGQILASASYDRLIRLWDVRTGADLGVLEEHNGPVYSIAFLPSGDELVSASADGTVKVWDVASRRRLVTLTGAEGPLNGLAVHPEGGQFATAGGDGTIRVWVRDGEDWQVKRSVVAHRSGTEHIVYSADGRRIVTGGTDRVVKIWDSNPLSRVGVWDPEPDSILALALSGDGSLALGRYDGSMRLVANAVE